MLGEDWGLCLCDDGLVKGNVVNMGATGRGLSLLYRRKDEYLFQYCDMSAFWQLRTWQRQVI
ncbi:hypothetical protein ACLK1Z_23710 [Escherichia coli]